MLKSLIAAGLLSLLAACAGSSMYYSGSITTTEDPRARDAATKQVPLKDRVVVVTQVNWGDGAVKGGSHAVRWNWYEGETLIAERSRTIAFDRSPFRFSHSLQAADLGLGRYRVEVLVDGVKVDEQTFFVVAS
jgi:hypothetical protein